MKSSSLAEKNIIKQDEHCGLFCQIANLLEDDPSNGIECLRNWQKSFFSIAKEHLRKEILDKTNI